MLTTLDIVETSSTVTFNNNKNSFTSLSLDWSFTQIWQKKEPNVHERVKLEWIRKTSSFVVQSEFEESTWMEYRMGYRTIRRGNQQWPCSQWNNLFSNKEREKIWTRMRKRRTDHWSFVVFDRRRMREERWDCQLLLSKQWETRRFQSTPRRTLSICSSSSCF